MTIDILLENYLAHPGKINSENAGKERNNFSSKP